MHYYKKDIADYHKKAGRLSMLQHGAYTLLMDACYDREIFPTRDEAIDWLWASSKEEVEAVDFVLSKFFLLEDGVFIQKRIMETLEIYHANSATNKRIANEREKAKREGKTTKREKDPTKRDEPLGKVNLTKNYELGTNNYELQTKNKDLNTMSSKHDNEAKSIFTFWCNTMNKNKSAFSPKRKKLIIDRLKEGYTETDISTAITNCSNTPHNMGQNSNNKQYNDIELICRNPEKLESFRDNPGTLNSQFSEKTHSNINSFKQFLDDDDGEPNE